MPYFHQSLVSGGWQKLSLAEQLGNIGSEVGRACKWNGKDQQRFDGAVDRALELFDLMLDDPRWKVQKRLKEVARAREVFCDTIFGENQYNTTLEDLDRYFFQFALLARKGR